MKSKTKLFLAALLIFTLVNSSFSTTALASDTDSKVLSEINTLSSVAEYDLTCGETKTFTVSDVSGNVYYVTFEPLDPVSRIASGSYRITKTRPNSWTASMIITISNNSIIKASSPSVSFPGTTIISQTATRNSNTTATMQFKYIKAQKPLVAGFKAVLSGSTIKTYIL